MIESKSRRPAASVPLARGTVRVTRSYIIVYTAESLAGLCAEPIRLITETRLAVTPGPCDESYQQEASASKTRMCVATPTPPRGEKKPEVLRASGRETLPKLLPEAQTVCGVYRAFSSARRCRPRWPGRSAQLEWRARPPITLRFRPLRARGAGSRGYDVTRRF